jgi:hypothetical protein
MHPELLKIWLDAKIAHLNFCQEIGVIYSEDSIKDQLRLLEQLQTLAHDTLTKDPEDVKFEIIS